MRQKRHVDQREPRDEEIQEFLDEFKTKHKETFELTRDLFSVLVNPELYYQDDVTEAEAMNLNLIFTEWALFDFKLESGLSLIEEAAVDDPSISEFAKTQFYSRFWLVKQDRRRGVVTLRDTLTQDEFEVWSSELAHKRAWRKGTLGTRIARVGDVWVTAGKTFLHDNAPDKPLPAKPGAREDYEADPWQYLREVEAVVGHDGIFRDSLRVVDL